MKTKHNYVWKKYLKPWTQNELIWTKRENNIFLTSLENIAQKRFFYETFALNDSEINFINEYIKKSHPSDHPVLFDTFKVFLDITYGDEEKRKTGLEEYHSFIEGFSIKFLDAIYINDYSFMNNDKLKNYFCYFIGVQYMRTRRQFDYMIEAFEKMFNDDQYRVFMTNLNSHSITKAIQLISSDHIGNWLSQVNIKFIPVKGNRKFLTCDQPVINISANPKNITEPPAHMTLLYPLSPYMAMIASENEINDIEFDENKVELYNDLIIKFSHEQIYATSKLELCN